MSSLVCSLSSETMFSARNRISAISLKGKSRKVGGYVVLITWLDDVVVPTFLEDCVQVVELDRRLVAPCRELGVQDVRASPERPKVFEVFEGEVVVLEAGGEEMETFASKTSV